MEKLIELARSGDTLTIKHGGFFPGAFIGFKRVNIRTAQACVERGLFRHVKFDPRHGDEYVLKNEVG
jgi:hypothetical protein